MEEKAKPKQRPRGNVSPRAERETSANGNVPSGRKNRGKVPGSGGPATPDCELLFRMRIVEKCLLDGMRGGEIIEALQAEGRTVPVSTVNHYIVRIRDKWNQEDSLLRPIRRERQTRKLHDVARKLEDAQAWGHWVAVQKLIADLEGNLAPVKVEHSQADPFEEWSLDELRAYIDSKGQSEPRRLATASGRLGERGPHAVASVSQAQAAN